MKTPAGPGAVGSGLPLRYRHTFEKLLHCRKAPVEVRARPACFDSKRPPSVAGWNRGLIMIALPGVLAHPLLALR